MRRAVLAFAALAALAGCTDPQLVAITVPPPGKTAELVDSSDERSIKISRGVAIGFSCTHQSAPCAGASASSGDASVARVFTSYADELSSYYCDPAAGGQCATPGAVFVLLGAKPGSTTLTVTTDDGDVELDVQVTP